MDQIYHKNIKTTLFICYCSWVVGNYSFFKRNYSLALEFYNFIILVTFFFSRFRILVLNFTCFIFQSLKFERRVRELSKIEEERKSDRLTTIF